MTLAFTILTPDYWRNIFTVYFILAQEGGDKSGDLTAAEDGEPFGGSNVGTIWARS
jgi:hypothetical protein